VTRVLTVTAPPQDSAPVARFSVSPPARSTGESVSFDGSASSDSDGDAIASYQWSFGDGIQQTTTTPVVSHAYSGSGTYTAQLVVIDARGTRSSATAHVVAIVHKPPRVVSLHVKARICAKRAVRCRRHALRVRFTLVSGSSGDRVALTVRRRGHRRVLVRRTADVSTGRNLVLVSIAGLLPGRYVLTAKPAGGKAATAGFKLRQVASVRGRH
jgi:hypothetical protein